MPSTFIFMTEYAEILDVALRVQSEGHTVLFHIESAEQKKIGDGLVEKISDWHRCLGEGYTWVFDGCSHGDLQDWLRDQGEHVFGGSKKGDALENDRQLGQKLFKQLGFKQPESHNFTSIDDALSFIEEHDQTRWILKQNGDLPKSINHMGKFDGSIDMIKHLKHLKKTWNETEYGKFDCDLMEIIEGTELAASAFWNGNKWMKNKEGKVVGFLNFEEKKECDGGLGATTGEMGTTFIGVTEDNKIFKQIILNPKLETVLRESGFHGVFDINGTLTEDGEFVGFEPTCRFGVPSSSYEFIEALTSDTGELLEACASERDIPIEIHLGPGLVMVIAAKPFPIEAHVEDDNTSTGEVLWFLDSGEPMDEPTTEQLEHIHLENFYKEENKEDGEVEYKVATDSGYLLTVTGRDGDTIEEVRDNLIQYIKDNLYISGMKYRTDIGQRIEDFVEEQGL